MATSPADTNRLYALIEAGEGQGGVYVSYDKGSSFKVMSHRKELVNRPFYYCNIYAHPKNADVIYSSANKFMISMDAGKTWDIRETPHGDNHDIWINPNHDIIWIQSNDGGGNVTFNSGKTWTTQFNQPTARFIKLRLINSILIGYTEVNKIITPQFLYQVNRYPIQTRTNAWILSTGGCETGPAVPKPSNPNIVYSNCKGRFGIYNKETGQENNIMLELKTCMDIIQKI